MVAFVALFAALAGGATAAGLISGKQVKDNSLTGKDVKNRSLTPLDFRGSVRGAEGRTGPQGAVGPRGPSNVLQFTNVTGGSDLAAATQVGQLTLPAGNHFVMAKTLLQGTLAAPASVDAQCTLRADGTELDQAVTRIDDSFFGAETLNLQAAVAGPVTLTLTCSVVSGNFNYQKVKMHAIQVESIG